MSNEMREEQQFGPIVEAYKKEHGTELRMRIATKSNSDYTLECSECGEENLDAAIETFEEGDDRPDCVCINCFESWLRGYILDNEKPEKFLLFAGRGGALGGARDLVGEFETDAEAFMLGCKNFRPNKKESAWWQVIKTRDWEVTMDSQDKTIMKILANADKKRQVDGHE